jgi:hypothetical protein
MLKIPPLVICIKKPLSDRRTAFSHEKMTISVKKANLDNLYDYLVLGGGGGGGKTTRLRGVYGKTKNPHTPNGLPKPAK